MGIDIKKGGIPPYNSNKKDKARSDNTSERMNTPQASSSNSDGRMGESARQTQPGENNRRRVKDVGARLPFDSNKRNGGWAEWIYGHRVGLLVTLVIYLVAIISFLSYRIVISKPEAHLSSIIIDFMAQPELTPEQPQPQEQQAAKDEALDFEKVLNKLSNENAKDDDKSSRSNVMSEAEAEAKRINDMLAQGQKNYEKGVNEADAIANSHKAGKSSANTSAGAKGSKANDSKTPKARERVKGNVVVSYDLPNRIDRYLYIPAYECEGGGKVVVNIVVNRSGVVTSASVASVTNSTSADDCIQQMALKASRSSQFDAVQSAPERQKGTITYVFVPQ